MLRNLDIFKPETPSHTTRRVALANGGEAFPYSDLSVGRIEGFQRTIPALVSDGVADGDNWYVVNLIDASNGMSRYVQSVAVLGATSEDQARVWALKNIGLFVGANDAWNTAYTSTKVLKTYLNRPSTSVAMIAIRQSDLDTIAAQITDKPVVWDGSRLMSHDATSLLHELVKHDDEVMMMDAMTPSDLPILMLEMGGELAEYDALIVDYNRLDLLMNRLNTAMQKSSVGNVKPVNVTQSKPFKRNSVTNVAALFEMSDGQSVTIVFHSPDNTPAKLSPSDTLTSWKWMLNKRDISAAVSPKNGENVQMPDLAKRILTIVEKNSARFIRANGNKAAQIQELTDTNTRIGQKQEALAGILAVNKDLQKQIDEAGKSSDSFKLNSVDDEDSLFITKTLAEIKVYEDQVKEKGIPYLSTNEFMGEIDADKRSGFSLDTLKKHLQENQDTLNGLMLGRITPRKVIGTGGTKNGAIAYLNRSIERDKTAINSGGFLSTVNMVNYSGYLRKLLADSKNQESEKPYSEQIITALVANHGWTASTNSSATKEFTGMAAGGELSDGTRMLTARFDDKGRYIGIDKDGFDSTPIPETDMDMRPYMTDAQGGAKAFNDMVEAYVAKQRDALKPVPVAAPTPAAKSTDLTEEELNVLRKERAEFEAKTAKIDATKSRDDALKVATALVTEMPEKEDAIRRAFKDVVFKNKWDGYEINFPKQPVKVATDMELNRTLKRLQKALEGTAYSIYGVFRNKFAKLEFAYGKGLTGKMHTASIEKRDEGFYNYDRTIGDWRDEEVLKPLMDATVDWLNGKTIPKMFIGKDIDWDAGMYGASMSNKLDAVFKEAKAKAVPAEPVTQPEQAPVASSLETLKELSKNTEFDSWAIKHGVDEGVAKSILDSNINSALLFGLITHDLPPNDELLKFQNDDVLTYYRAKAEDVKALSDEAFGLLLNQDDYGEKTNYLAYSILRNSNKKAELDYVSSLGAMNNRFRLDAQKYGGKLYKMAQPYLSSQPVEAQPEPASEPPMTNPDRDYLQSIIDGKVDPLTVDMDAVIALAEKYDGDAEITPLLDQALEAINQAEQEAAKGI